MWLCTIALCLWYRFQLSCKPIAQVLSESTAASKPHKGKEPQNLDDRKILSLIKTTERNIPYLSCLVKALAGKRMLSLLGYESELHVGVKKESEAGVTAHAWLSVDGQIIIGDSPSVCLYRQLPLVEVSQLNKKISLSK